MTKPKPAHVERPHIEALMPDILNFMLLVLYFVVFLFIALDFVLTYIDITWNWLNHFEACFYVYSGTREAFSVGLI